MRFFYLRLKFFFAFILLACVVYLLIINYVHETEGKWSNKLGKFGDAISKIGLNYISIQETLPAVKKNVTRSKKLYVKRKYKIPVNCSAIVDETNRRELYKADKITRKHRDHVDKQIKSFKPIMSIFHSRLLQDEYEVSKKLLRDLKMIPDENFIFDDDRCEEFIATRGYNTYLVTEEEKTFPLAFSILTHEEVEQFERLLRTIYRPQNVYCIHMDAKSSNTFHRAIESIAKCFPNVFVTTKLERIVHQGFKRLQADINCMKDLTTPSLELKSTFDSETQANIEKFWSHERIKGKTFRHDWKYLLNLASSEFPIRTNRELVQILSIYNGTNDIEFSRYSPKQRKRFELKWKYVEELNQLEQTDVFKQPPPHKYNIFKNVVYSSFSRAFVEFSLKSLEAKALLDWLEDTFLPEESYWGTLQNNLQFKPPGSFERILNDDQVTHMSRFIGWEEKYECDPDGYRRNGICMLSNRDLNYVTRQPHFFANKFQLIDDPVAYSCMENWYAQRHQRENEVIKDGTKTVIDMTPYCEYLFKISSGKIYNGCENYFIKNLNLTIKTIQN